MATYYVRQSGGSDGNSGLSFALGWATVQYALSNATSGGDIIVICSDGIHLPTATLTLSAYGQEYNPIIITGGNATGVIDGTIPVISGASAPASSTLLSLNAAGNYRVENLRFTASTNDGVLLNSSINGGTFSLVNCRVDNSARHGIYVNETYHQFRPMFVGCEIDNNTDRGIYPGTASGFGCCINCSIHDNGSIFGAIGCRNYAAGAQSHLIGCRIYNNTGSGLYVTSSSSGALHDVIIMNNVFFNNGSHGISLADYLDSYNVPLFNNIFRNNGGYGIAMSYAYLNIFRPCLNNCTSNNTSGAINQNGGVLPGSGNITLDPLFTSEVYGSENFTLQSGSPCINAGYGYDG